MDLRKRCCLCNCLTADYNRLTDGQAVCNTCATWYASFTLDKKISWRRLSAGDVKTAAIGYRQIDDVWRPLVLKSNEYASRFVPTDWFNGPDGQLVSVDDTHGLVRLAISRVASGCPGSISRYLTDQEMSRLSPLTVDGLILEISQLAGAEIVQVREVEVKIHTNVDNLPPLIMVISQRARPEISPLMIGGYVASMLEATQDQIEDLKRQAARRMAQDLVDFVTKLIDATNPRHTTELSAPDELLKWKGLLDSGVISQVEFDAKKKQLLTNTSPG